MIENYLPYIGINFADFNSPTFVSELTDSEAELIHSANAVLLQATENQLGDTESHTDSDWTYSTLKWGKGNPGLAVVTCFVVAAAMLFVVVNLAGRVRKAADAGRRAGAPTLIPNGSNNGASETEEKMKEVDNDNKLKSN